MKNKNTLLVTYIVSSIPVFMIMKFFSSKYYWLNVVLNIIGKTTIAIGPIALLLFIYFSNKKLIIALEKGKELPKNILNAYGTNAPAISISSSKVVGYLSLSAAIIYAAIIVYFLLLSDTSTFLEIT